MRLLLVALVVVVGFAMFSSCVVSGVWSLLSAFRQPCPGCGRAAGRGVVKLAAALVLTAVPWVAAPIAESSTGWVDTDHDGMLDGFVNGSYDWVDINAGRWAAAAAVMVLTILGFVVLTLAVMRRSQDQAAADGDAAGVAG